jgi:hypothetical protein
MGWFAEPHRIWTNQKRVHDPAYGLQTPLSNAFTGAGLRLIQTPRQPPLAPTWASGSGAGANQVKSAERSPNTQEELRMGMENRFRFAVPRETRA